MTFETERLTALRRALAAGLLGAAALAAGPAGAQVAAPSPMIVSPQEVGACLCLERAVSQLSDEVLARHRICEEQRRQLEQLDGELAERRARLKVNDTAQVDAF